MFSCIIYNAKTLVFEEPLKGDGSDLMFKDDLLYRLFVTWSQYCNIIQSLRSNHPFYSSSPTSLRQPLQPHVKRALNDGQDFDPCLFQHEPIYLSFHLKNSNDHSFQTSDVAYRVYILADTHHDTKFVSVQSCRHHHLSPTSRTQPTSLQLQVSSLLFRHLSHPCPTWTPLIVLILPADVIPDTQLVTWDRVMLTPLDHDQNMSDNHTTIFPSIAFLRKQLLSISFRNNAKLALISKTGKLIHFEANCQIVERGDHDTLNPLLAPFGVITSKTNLEVQCGSKSPAHEMDSKFMDEKEIDAIYGKPYSKLKHLFFSSCQSHLPVSPIRTILIHGPLGTGKSTITQYLAQSLEMDIETVTGPTFNTSHLKPNPFMALLSKRRDMNSMSQSPQTVSPSTNARPLIVFFDDIEGILGDQCMKDSTGELEVEHEQDFVKAMQHFLDYSNEYGFGGPCLVVATVRNILSLSIQTRQVFQREIQLNLPSEDAKFIFLRQLERIFRHKVRSQELMNEKENQNQIQTTSSVDDETMIKLAKSCHGANFCDLVSLFQHSVMNAALRQVQSARKPESNNSTMDLEPMLQDWILSRTAPAWITSNELTHRSPWLDINSCHLSFENIEHSKSASCPAFGLDYPWLQLVKSTHWLDHHGSRLLQLGVDMPRGVLLYGPPGTGKTMLAKAVAMQTHANFITISIPDLIKSYVGESELAIAKLFHLARQTSPCILFIDEIQALFTSRDVSGHHGRTMLSQLILELDNMDTTKKIVLIAATNHPEWIDASLLRPGRLDQLIYIPPPDREARRAILAYYMHQSDYDIQCQEEAFLEQIASDTDGWTGADLKNMCLKARWQSWKRNGMTLSSPSDLLTACHQVPMVVIPDDVRAVLDNGMSASVTPEMLRKYQDFEKTR